MAFDYRKFESRISLGDLVRLGSSREVLKHGAARYALGASLPGEYRKALRESGISPKKLQRQVRDARELGRTLALLQQNPRVVVDNSTAQQVILRWRLALEEAAQWLNTLPVFRPDAKNAALALALHVEQRTGERHLPEICTLLNAALTAAGLPAGLTVVALEGQIKRANHQRAEEMLRFWKSLVPAKKQQK